MKKIFCLICLLICAVSRAAAPLTFQYQFGTTNLGPALTNIIKSLATNVVNNNAGTGGTGIETNGGTGIGNLFTNSMLLQPTNFFANNPTLQQPAWSWDSLGDAYTLFIPGNHQTVLQYNDKPAPSGKVLYWGDQQLGAESIRVGTIDQNGGGDPRITLAFLFDGSEIHTYSFHTNNIELKNDYQGHANMLVRWHETSKDIEVGDTNGAASLQGSNVVFRVSNNGNTTPAAEAVRIWANKNISAQGNLTNLGNIVMGFAKGLFVKDVSDPDLLHPVASTDSDGNIALGDSSMSAVIVNSENGIKISSGAGNGKILVSDSLGLASWQLPLNGVHATNGNLYLDTGKALFLQSSDLVNHSVLSIDAGTGNLEVFPNGDGGINLYGGVNIQDAGLYAHHGATITGDTLNVGAGFIMASGAGSGKVLTSDGSGVGTWQDAAGGSGVNYWTNDAALSGAISNVNNGDFRVVSIYGTTTFHGTIGGTGWGIDATGRLDANEGSITSFAANEATIATLIAPNQVIARGLATLSSGTVTVTTSAAHGTNDIILTRRSAGGATATVNVDAIVNDTSFTIKSSDGSDNKTVSYLIFKP